MSSISASWKCVELFHCVDQDSSSVITVFNFEWGQGYIMKAAPFGDHSNEQTSLALVLWFLDHSRNSTTVWLSAALLWHLDVIQPKKRHQKEGHPVMLLCLNVRQKVCAFLQWSEAESAHSHRRHPYHLPGQAGGCREIHLQSEQQPGHIALSISLPDCSVWVLPWQQCGGGGAGRRYSSCVGRTAAAVWRLLFGSAARTL